MREFNYRESMQKLFRNAFGALSLYYQSLQNLVEGRREVLNNDKFVFEDGMTVEEKRIRFENYLIRYFGIRQSKENQE